MSDELRGLLLEYTWSFARKNLVLTTIAPKSDGTIAVDPAGLTVTGTGTSFVDPDDVEKCIRLPDANFYEVTAVAAGPQTLTLAAPYVGTTLAAGATYSLFQHRHALPDDIQRILTMGSQLSAVREATQFDLDARDPQRRISGQPLFYLPIGLNALGQAMIEIWPIPDAAYHLPYVALKKTVTVSIPRPPIFQPAQAAVKELQSLLRPPPRGAAIISDKSWVAADASAALQ